MRIKPSRTRRERITPAPLPQRRKRRNQPGARGRKIEPAPAKPDPDAVIDTIQWIAFAGIALAAVAMIALIWILIAGTVGDKTTQLRGRADQHVKSLAAVLAREIGDELAIVDQSLKIVQDAWARDSATVDLGRWRSEGLAMTAVARDIFIANSEGTIVQGTLPDSVGQAFGTSYVTYPNGSLEVFDPNGVLTPEGKTSSTSAQTRFEARQYLIYLLRPLDRPKGWMVGGSWRSKGLTDFYAEAGLGPEGLVALAATDSGALRAVAGSSVRTANLEIGDSSLGEAIRRNAFGIWTGESPTDEVSRIVAFQRLPGRNMAVMVGIGMGTALEPIAGLRIWAYTIAIAATGAIAVIAWIMIWSIATYKTRRRQKRQAELTELQLLNARKELDLTRVLAKLTETEAGALMNSADDGVARLDEAGRLRVWNDRFIALVGVPMDTIPAGTPVEALLYRQAEAGLFPEDVPPEDQVAMRLTVLHTGGQSGSPPFLRGPDGETLTMHIRGIVDGGNLMILAPPRTVRRAALPVLAEELEPESTEW